MEIFALGRLQSNSSPVVPGLEAGGLSNFHTVMHESSRFRWLGFRMRSRFSVSLHSLAPSQYPGLLHYMTFIVCPIRTDVTSKVSHACRGISRFFSVPDLCHPRRPRGSQMGREKGRDGSF